MNKQELINVISKNAKLTKASAALALDALLKAIKEALREGKEVRLTDFGTFKKNKAPSRTVRNPRNGQPVKVPSTYRIRFSAGKDFKKHANS